MKPGVTTVAEAVGFLIRHYSDLHDEHRFEKISDCADSIMKSERPGTTFRHEDGSWTNNDYCDYYINLIATITVRWDSEKNETRSNT